MTFLRKISPSDLSFKQQLMWTFGISIVCFSLFSAFIVVSIASKTVYEQFVLQGEKLTETFADQSVLSLLYSSQESAREASKAILTFPDVSHVAIIDKENNLLFEEGVQSFQPITMRPTDPETHWVETNNLWVFLKPVFSEQHSDEEISPFASKVSKSEHIGFVQVTLSKDRFMTMKNDILRGTIFVTLGLLLLLMFLLLYVSNRMLVPLKQLAMVMGQAKNGDISVRASLGGSSDVIAMEHAFNSMISELETRDSEIRKARDAALDVAKTKGEFAATVSHELRTPMNGVLGMLQLLEGSSLEPRIREYVEFASRSAKALLVLIDDILDFSKLESGKMKFYAEDFGVRELLMDVVSLLSVQSQSKKLMLNAIVHLDVPNGIRADSGRLRQVLINLIGNAIKFTSRGMITVRLSLVFQNDNPEFWFEVEDTGIGIATEDQNKIFDSFVQADGSTTRNFGGTGLGLSICRQLVQLMGGQLSVSSELGKGSIFRFSIPFVEAKSDPTTKSRVAEFSKLKVCIFGVSQMRSSVLRETLESWGCSQITVKSYFALSASQSELTNQVDLILIDTADVESIDYEELFHELGKLTANTIVLSNVLQGSATSACLKILPLAIDSASIYREIIQLYRFEFLDADKNNLEDTPSSHFANAHVLVVEDNEANQMVIVGMLERLGCKVEVAESGALAVQKFFEKSFDLVLMDCRMPIMDGYAATELIRSRTLPGFSPVPILAMTAQSSDEDRQRCFASGMNDYIVKPVDFGELRTKLGQWLRLDSHENKVPEESAIEFETTTVDKKARPFPVSNDRMFKLRQEMGAVFPRMLTAFIEDTPLLLQKLEKVVGQSDVPMIVRVSHCLADSASNIGAKTLEAYCRDLEKVANSGDLGDIEHQLNQIIEVFHEVDAALRDELFVRKRSLRLPSDLGQTILIVDDDQSSRFALRGILERDGFAIVEAQNGYESVKLCDERMPDLILMDAMMPQMDGFDACREILKSAGDAKPIILIVTALHDEESIERAFAAGATDFISKPVNLVLLRKRVNRLLHSSRMEKQVQQLANVDTLTGLLNREMFLDLGREVIRKSYMAGGMFALLYIDLDRFTQVNETLGHEVGDLLLESVGQRLIGAVREGDLVARVSGDEFAIILDRIQNVELVGNIADKIRALFSRPFSFMGNQVFSRVSIGIAIYPQNGNNIGSLLKHADTALYRAKGRGGDCIQYFDYDMETEIVRKSKMERELRKGLVNGELVLHYQAQLDAKTGLIRGVEALVRWQHPERGLLPPLEFIGLAEETGLISDIGDWVLGAACAQQVRWCERGLPPISVSVNVSSHQLETGELCEKISAIIESTSMQPEMLILELTENTLVDTTEKIIEQMQHFRSMGIAIEIDDFGTGYSSLSYLKRFPINALKIDRAFVKDLPDDKNDLAIVSGVIALAHNMGLSIVAEGVETDEQMALLESLGCDTFQGYLISRPLPSLEFESWLLSRVPC